MKSPCLTPESFDGTSACRFVEALCASTLAASFGTAILGEVLSSWFLATVTAWCVFGWWSSALALVTLSWVELVGYPIEGQARRAARRQESVHDR